MGIVGTTDLKTSGAPIPLYGVDDKLVRELSTALGNGQAATATNLIAEIHGADQADIFERLSPSLRRRFKDLLLDQVQPEFWVNIDEGLRVALFCDMESYKISTLVQKLETDDAVRLLGDLRARDRSEILKYVSEPNRALFEEALCYPEDTAGRLMRREKVTVPEHWKVGDVIDFLTDVDELPEALHNLFVVDPLHSPVGYIPVYKLLGVSREEPISPLIVRDIKVLPVMTDKEEVGLFFRQYGYVSASVVDADGVMLGVITIDDVVTVIDEEAEEDILKLAGVQGDDFYDAVIATTRARISWLLVNLLTVTLSALVIGFFDTEIEKLVALAILMPIVTALGGNAGTQALTVAVRAIATKELTVNNTARTIGKEILVGGINGLILATILLFIVGFWFSDVGLGAVFAMAIIINMVVAGFIGVAVPMALYRSGIDPAVASSVLVTAATDIVGFFCFLGLAAWLIF